LLQKRTFEAQVSYMPDALPVIQPTLSKHLRNYKLKMFYQT